MKSFTKKPKDPTDYFIPLGYPVIVYVNGMSFTLSHITVFGFREPVVWLVCIVIVRSIGLSVLIVYGISHFTIHISDKQSSQSEDFTEELSQISSMVYNP